MKEYFVVATSKAAPFISDESFEFIQGDSPEDALKRFRKRYNHPFGLFAANVYANANDYHRFLKPLASYRTI